MVMSFQITQMQKEADAWKRSLSYLREENVFLKQHLVDLVKEAYEPSILESLEAFQNRFIQEDERQSLLRNDISTLYSLLKNPQPANDQWRFEIDQKMLLLRTNIRIAEAEFAKLKSGFHAFMSNQPGT